MAEEITQLVTRRASMTKQQFPTPQNFPYDKVFYFDGEIALMYGTYKDTPHKSLGMRWMEAESELGFPNTFGREMWMVVPDRLAKYILAGLIVDEGSTKVEMDISKVNEALFDISKRTGAKRM
jgi:hypothetical protein